MSNSEDISARNREHYDSVTDAWGYLLGDNLHYGFFAPGISTGYCQVLVAHSALDGNRGAPIRLDVRYDGGRKHLPIVDLRLVA